MRINTASVNPKGLFRGGTVWYFRDTDVYLNHLCGILVAGTECTGVKRDTNRWKIHRWMKQQSKVSCRNFDEQCVLGLVKKKKSYLLF